jgi:hypothetical protein
MIQTRSNDQLHTRPYNLKRKDAFFYTTQIPHIVGLLFVVSPSRSFAPEHLFTTLYDANSQINATLSIGRIIIRHEKERQNLLGSEPIANCQ